LGYFFSLNPDFIGDLIDIIHQQ